MNALSDARTRESTKDIAIVSHPEIGIDAIKRHLDAKEGEAFAWQHLPPVHMLGRNTADEQATYDYLLGRTNEGAGRYPFGILAIVDVSELERQLYLVSQLIDLRLPTVIGLVGLTGAEKKGISLNVAKMGAQFGVPVLEVEGEENVDNLVGIAEKTFIVGAAVKPTHWRPSVGLANAYHHIDKHWVFDNLKLHTGARLIEGLRLIGVARAVEEYAEHPAYDKLVEELAEARRILEQKKENWAMAEIFQRTNWVNQIIASTTTKSLVQAEVVDPGWRKKLKSLFSR